MGENKIFVKKIDAPKMQATRKIIPVDKPGSTSGRAPRNKASSLPRKFHPTTIFLYFLGIAMTMSGNATSWNLGLASGLPSYVAMYFIMGLAYVVFCLCMSEVTSALPFAGGAFGLARCTLGFFPAFMIGCSETLEYVASVAGAVVSDFVEWHWVKGRTLRFQPKRPFPLTNLQAAIFIELCDTLVANFPDLTQPPDLAGKIRTYNITPQRDIEWTWVAGELRAFEDGILRNTTTVHTQFQMQRQPLVDIAGRPTRPIFECTPELTRLALPWRGDKPWCPKRRHHKRALGRKGVEAGHAARQERMAKWKQDHQDVADALAVVPWHEMGRAEGLTTYDQQVWARLRHHQLFVRAFGAANRGCTRDGCGMESEDDAAHLVWDCTHAKALWFKLARFWGAPEITEDELRKAVFSRSPPRTAPNWRALFQVRDSCIGDRLEYWERALWTLLTTCALHKLWAQSVNTAMGGRDAGGHGDFYAVLHNWAQRLRSAITSVYTRARDSTTLDVDILTAIYKGMVLHTDVPPRVITTTTKYLLFFDGGSRGNPGAGGSGSVVVRVRGAPEIVWAGSMSYARISTTNNLAEYQGLCTGLDAAERYGWAPLEVVGDSMMIIRQMLTRRRPKAPTLRPLYEKARSIADALRLRRWHHHYRTHNKMADKAANQAMDSGTSYQAHANDGRPELEELREWLANDVTQWLQSQPDNREQR